MAVSYLAETLAAETHRCRLSFKILHGCFLPQFIQEVSRNVKWFT